MKVAQVYEIVNTLSSEILGSNAPQIGGDNIKDIVDVGRSIFENIPVDNYVKKLVDHIGRMVFVNRPYSGRAPSVLMDGWEYGSILEKVDAGIPEAEANPSWSLTNGQTYNQDVFNGPKDVVVKFYNDKVTFQVAMSFAEEQIKSSFSNVNQLNAFFSMIYTKIDTTLTIRVDSLIMATINNFIANVYNSGNDAQKVNLAENFAGAENLESLLNNKDFIRNAAYQLKVNSDYLTNVSTVFNIGKRVRHTPKDLQKIIMLNAFSAKADIYLQSDVFHNELTALPSAEKVSFWQYSGNKYAIDDVSTVDVIPNTEGGAGVETKVPGVMAVIFDRDALGVNNYNRRTTNHYNGLGEFINFWYKMDSQYFNDFNENFILFYAEIPPATPEEPEEP